MLSIILSIIAVFIVVVIVFLIIFFCYATSLSLFMYNDVWIQKVFPAIHEKYSDYYLIKAEDSLSFKPVAGLILFLVLIVVFFSLLGKYSSLCVLLYITLSASIFFSAGSGNRTFLIAFLICLVVAIAIFLWLNPKLERVRFIKSWILETVGVCVSIFEIGYTALCLKYTTTESHIFKNLDKINYKIAFSAGVLSACIAFIFMVIIHILEKKRQKKIAAEMEQQALMKAEAERNEFNRKRMTSEEIAMFIKAIDSLKKALRRMSFSDLEIKDIGILYDEYSQIKSTNDGKKKLASLKKVFKELVDFYKNSEDRNDVKWFEECTDYEKEVLYKLLMREFNGDNSLRSSLDDEYGIIQINNENLIE